MSAFHEELTAARKAKGMTQEQLAEAMSASRSAVSHWESGRSVPDINTLKQLSTVLGCTFSVQAVPQTEEPAQTETTAAQPDAPARKIPAKWIILLAALLAVAAVFVFAVLPALTSKPEPAKTVEPTIAAVLPPKAPTVEWFSSPVQPENGKPFVAVQFSESPLHALHNDDFPEGVGWLYSVYLTETSGYALNMTGYEQVIF